MKVSSTISCCPCSWPYFLTLSYISGRKNHTMEETLKPASLSLSPVGQSLLPSHNASVSVNTPSDAGDSVKSPNMSTDSGFEGENNRPLILATTPSPSNDIILNSWRSDMCQKRKEALRFDAPELSSPKSPKKSADDSDFNESPFDKKSVPSVGDLHSESDNEFSSEHNCPFFTSETIWGHHASTLKSDRISQENVDIHGSQKTFVCMTRCTSEEKCSCRNRKNHIDLEKCVTCCKIHFITCEESEPCHCSSDVKWNGTLASIHEDSDCVIYAENEIGTNSEDDFDSQCKLDNETDTSDEKMFDGAYSDEALSAYYVPSAISMLTEDYQQPVDVLNEKMLTVDIDDTASEDSAGSCLCHIGMCKSSRCQNEGARYTTVLKPKAVRPTANPNRIDYHSSLESLHSQHVVAAIGQHHNRLSAFHERPSSSLSQREGIHYFFSRSLDMPPTIPASRQTSSQLSIVTASDFPTSNSCLLNKPHSQVSSLNNIDVLCSTSHSSKSSCSGHHNRLSENRSDIVKKSEQKSPENQEKTASDENFNVKSKRFSVPWDLLWKNDLSHRQASNYDPNSEPIHMTLEEVHSSLQILNPQEAQDRSANSSKRNSEEKHPPLGFFGSYLRQKKCRRHEKTSSQTQTDHDNKYQRKSFPVFIKSALNNLFGLKKNIVLENNFPSSRSEDELTSHSCNRPSPNTSPFTNRALPPVPVNGVSEWEDVEESWTTENNQSQLYDCQSEDLVRRQMDYAASIEKVKDCGWYWGPISGETAEKLLSGEPDGSFVVRDSSDEHYIFSLTFKLNGLVRHVRIEHDHGNFSFGCLQKFRSNTIVDFIDSAVAHSRSGRYLFFLHRRPVLGPMRVQLLHPVSRFKQVQSLQHMCRFIILKTLRRDLIDHLPLPRRLKDYLNTPHYYSEELATLSLLSKKYSENRSSCRRSSQPESRRTADSSSSEQQSNSG